jgi:hypothetical protein
VKHQGNGILIRAMRAGALCLPRGAAIMKSVQPMPDITKEEESR